VGQDEVSKKPFVKCEQNREGDSFRSHHSNKYFPEAEVPGSAFPTKRARLIEEQTNYLLEEYLTL
jgi:capping protein (actin filament) muscle Z-line, beta